MGENGERIQAGKGGEKPAETDKRGLQTDRDT